MKENSINEKEVDEVDNVIKISIPIISNQEIENIINTEGLYDKIAEQIYHDREMIILQEFIKKLQKENEELKQDRNNNYQNYIIKKQIEKYKTYIEQLRRELGQKDKIIDLMAETINNHDIDEDICKQMGQKANCNEFEDTEKCKECIKQYFENKAKEIK
nr:MAG TPA: hypothetical protein [Caudoviricetes sp.]